MIWADDPTFRTPHLPAVWLVATLARPVDRAERSRLRRDTARQVFAGQDGFSGWDGAIGHLPSGQPVLPARPDLYLSLATRGGVVAVGLAESPIGVDVEAVEPAADIPLPLLHPQEQAALAVLDGLQRAVAFSLIWAAKEAYVKALGTGLLREPESFAVSLPGGGRFAVFDPARRDTPQGRTRLIENGGQVALAAAAIVLQEA
ncbi:4'-phosphopantetheinyl transferase family protein [Bosea sp. (in: a-proteobacteria)]|uniref:4'-phosphopantetheinyl transferase family protein n=1 Tax=Bosea sp. (in: a-proteobacteria) TaxID=1871050 RepID=UPI003B3A8812